MEEEAGIELDEAGPGFPFLRRVQAFQQAAAEFQETAKRQPGIVIAGTCVGDYVREVARDAVARWLAANAAPDACLAANDVMALGALEAITAAREQKFVQYEGLASELAGRFYRDRGFSAVGTDVRLGKRFQVFTRTLT